MARSTEDPDRARSILSFFKDRAPSSFFSQQWQRQYHSEEHLDILTENGEKTGISKSRKLVHRDGDYQRAVHVWIYAESTRELLLQRRASRDSWPEQWDIRVLELQELQSALEEAKADIVGLWALKFLIDPGLLPKTLLKSMYVSFLAGCFCSIRFGLEEAHGKGQALQFNWLCEKGGFVLHSDGTFSVNFTKVEEAVQSLSREILTIQAMGDNGAKSLLQSYAIMTQPLKSALENLENVQVSVDIAPIFAVANNLLNETS